MPRFGKLVAVFSLWLACSSAVAADPLSVGVNAYERGSYAAAFNDFMAAAKAGAPEAAYNLAGLYRDGRGVPQDFKRAMFWSAVAASCGVTAAQGVIGDLYSKGEGVPQSYATAAAYFLTGANDGDAPSQFSAGKAYFLGQGVPQDFVTAYMWFNLSAADAPDAELQKMAATFRDNTMSLMTPGQIAQGQAAAAAWQPNYLRPPPPNDQAVAVFVPGRGWVCPRAEVAAASAKAGN